MHRYWTYRTRLMALCALAVPALFGCIIGYVIGVTYGG